MNANPLAVTESLQKAFETLRSLSQNPQQVETVQIHRSAEAIHIQVILHTSSAPPKSRWARFADELHTESPLRGRSEQLIAQSREFRNQFSFESTDRS